MPSETLNEQLTKYLTDAHSIEEQAFVQMRAAPRIAGEGEIAGAFAERLAETEGHESRIRLRLEDRGASPSGLDDLAGKVTDKGFALFAQFQPDTPGKLVAHAYSYEHLELGAYDLLARVARLAADEATVEAAEATVGGGRGDGGGGRCDGGGGRCDPCPGGADGPPPGGVVR